VFAFEPNSDRVLVTSSGLSESLLFGVSVRNSKKLKTHTLRLRTRFRPLAPLATLPTCPYMHSLRQGCSKILSLGTAPLTSVISAHRFDKTMPSTLMQSVVSQLQKERTRLEDELHRVTAALTAFGKVYLRAKFGRRKRTISAAGRKRIAAAQRARWARVRAGKKR
jgi:hypothetical protein